MNKILQTISNIGIIPVIAIDDAAKAVPLARALADGGLPAAEVTFRTACAEDCIKMINKEVPEMLLGAGTVLTTDPADRAMAAGAKFIVAPGYDPKVTQHVIDRGGLMMQKGIGRVLSGLQRAGKEQQELAGKISAAGQTDAVGKKDSADSTGTVGRTGTADNSAVLVTALVLFCASGTGIYGSIVAGMTGDHSILLAKSILDFATALIFACSLGIVVSLIAVPQFLIFMALYLLAGMIYPLCTPGMINDFKACGGILLLATGFRMIKVKEFPVADMIPAMVLALPVSYLWINYIMPLMG